MDEGDDLHRDTLLTDLADINETFEGFEKHESSVSMIFDLDKISKELEFLGSTTVFNANTNVEVKDSVTDVKAENTLPQIQLSLLPIKNEQPRTSTLPAQLKRKAKRKSLDFGIRSKKSRFGLIGTTIARRKSELDISTGKDQLHKEILPSKKSPFTSGNNRTKRTPSVGTGLVTSLPSVGLPPTASSDISPSSTSGMDNDGSSRQQDNAIVNCSISCPKAMGLIPTLQCSICLCLFHTQCADVDPVQAESLHGTYVCQSCQNKSKTNGISGQKMQFPTPVSNPKKPAPSVTSTISTRARMPEPTPQVIPKPIVPQFIVTVNHRRFIVVPNLGPTEQELEKINNKSGLPLFEQKQLYPNWLNMHNEKTLYKVMLHVFEYLTIQELLRASRVCKVWNTLAHQPILWHSVNMRNSRVANWNQFTNTLAKNGATYLDLRKMLNNTDPEWNKSYVHLTKVKTLRELYLDVCDVFTLRKLIAECPYVEVLHVHKVTSNIGIDETLLLNAFTMNHQLRHFYVRGAKNLNVSDLVFAPLVNNNFKSLSVLNANFVQPSDLLAIKDLVTLETLELGSCANFDKDFMSIVLPVLKNLKRLRLEHCIDKCPVNNILDTISQLSHLKVLELVNFTVQGDFHKVFAKCTNLERVMLIPSCLHQSSIGMNLLLRGVFTLSKTLKQLVCGVTVELLEMTDYYVDRPRADKSYNFIPVLAPLPLPPDADPSLKFWKSGTEAKSGIVTVTLDEFREALSMALPQTKISIVKVHMVNTWTLSINAY